MKPQINIVWFKRDLRLTDHEPLRRAVQGQFPVLLLYIFEPSLLKDGHYHPRHWNFVEESLSEMNTRLESHETKIQVFQDEVLNVFDWLRSQFDIEGIYSHQETGLRITYERDLSCKSFFDSHQIAWYEFQHGGVVRGLKNRHTWVRDWYAYMEKSIQKIQLDQAKWQKVEVPERMIHPLSETKSHASIIQSGGTNKAWQYLNSFIRERHKNYMRTISSPLKSREHSSRLSPYLAWGNISSREAYQAVLPLSKGNRNFRAFLERLRWRCHFIQKFEMEDRMEFEHVNRGYEQVEYAEDQEKLEAWKMGKTGYPMVDASMRSLIATGFLNFRMRAMLVSFLTHHLFMHWKKGSHWLAQQFLDFEPGIHFSQLQMQAGVTGINTLRIYNPIKQAQDHDPKGEFIKKWVPEIGDLPTPFLHEPWAMTSLEKTMYGFENGSAYGPPIIPPSELGKRARTELWSLRKDGLVLKEGKRILAKLTNPGRRHA